MRHIKVTFEREAGDIRDMLIAVLAENGYDGFEEDTAHLHAFVPEDQFDESVLVGVAAGVTFTTEAIEPQNWNELWEAGIEPVVVDGFCTIKTHFHDVVADTPYVIVITPKMSFGTGHHATTQLMMMGMQPMDFKGKSVLDFGTGTGVLAILAGMLGATDITAIDNDEWAVDNAKENMTRNDGAGIEVSRSSLEDITERKYDIILANINRHILLQFMGDLYNRLYAGGTLLMSGLLVTDEDIMRQASTGVGFDIVSVNTRNGWISINCAKR